jgi:hypothetical protein
MDTTIEELMERCFLFGSPWSFIRRHNLFDFDFEREEETGLGMTRVRIEY